MSDYWSIHRDGPWAVIPYRSTWAHCGVLALSWAFTPPQLAGA